MLDYMTALHLRFKRPSQRSQDLKQQVTILHRQLASRLENLNEKQLDTFMDVIRQDAIWYDFFYTELTIGLRRSEICGLMWSDFDAHSGILKINRTLYREKGGRLVVGDTKTYVDTRKIVLSHSTAQLLGKRK